MKTHGFRRRRGLPRQCATRAATLAGGFDVLRSTLSIHQLCSKQLIMI